MTDNSERNEYLFDIFTTALEGGVDYWSECEEYEWRRADGSDDLIGFHASIRADRDEWLHEVDRLAIRRGLKLICEATAPFYDPNGAGTQCADVPFLDEADARAIQEATNDLDAGDIDAHLADVIVQVGLFGEVRYS